MPNSSPGSCEGLPCPGLKKARYTTCWDLPVHVIRRPAWGFDPEAVITSPGDLHRLGTPGPLAAGTVHYGTGMKPITC